MRCNQQPVDPVRDRAHGRVRPDRDLGGDRPCQREPDTGPPHVVVLDAAPFLTLPLAPRVLPLAPRALPRARRRRIREHEPWRRPRRCCPGDRRLELVNALSGGTHHAHHLTSEHAAQRVDVDRDALAFGDVDHVQRDHRRHPHLDQLEGEVQMPFEIRGVEHVDDDVDVAAQDRVAGDELIGGGGVERVGARKVDEGEPRPVEVVAADLAFDGHARPVAGLLTDTGEGVEQRGLAGVRVPCERDRQRLRFAVMSVTMTERRGRAHARARSTLPWSRRTGSTWMWRASSGPMAIRPAADATTTPRPRV
jgi:hypothetical protein